MKKESDSELFYTPISKWREEDARQRHLDTLGPTWREKVFSTPMLIALSVTSIFGTLALGEVRGANAHGETIGQHLKHQIKNLNPLNIFDKGP